MFKILGLLCLSTAYALSVMYLNGVKLSDSQVSEAGEKLQGSGKQHCLLDRPFVISRLEAQLVMHAPPVSKRWSASLGGPELCCSRVLPI